jgi:hypothetical protein
MRETFNGATADRRTLRNGPRCARPGAENAEDFEPSSRNEPGFLINGFGRSE